MTDEDIGYLKRAVEDMEKLLTDTLEQGKKERADLKGELKRLTGDIRDIRDQLSVAKTLLKTGKFFWYLLILIVTLKIGDVSKLWEEMFK